MEQHSPLYDYKLIELFFQILGSHKYRLHSSQDSQENRADDIGYLVGSFPSVYSASCWLEGRRVVHTGREQNVSRQSRDRISDIRNVIVLLLASDGDTDTVLEDISNG